MIRRSQPKQLQAAHRPQPFRKLSIIEPSAMPLVANADLGVEKDGEHCGELGECEEFLGPGQDQGHERQKHGQRGKHEIEHVAAAIGLGEIAGEAVRPFVPVLQSGEGRVDRPHAFAGIAIISPFGMRLPCRRIRAPVVRAKARHAGGCEQERIFDPRADLPPALALEHANEGAFLIIGWGR
jgi:hypothetical protein